MPHQTQGAERRGDRRGQGRRQRRGGHEGALDRAAKPNRIETKPGTLYKLSPRTSIEKNHVLRSSACSSWIPVRDARCALRITGEGRKGREGKGGGGEMRWDETHQPLSLRDRLVRSGFLAALSSAFASRRRTWGEVVGGRRGAGCSTAWARVGGDGMTGPKLC